jgi:hypothetical protein
MTCHGKWWITPDGHVCTQFSTFNQGHETCTLSYRDGNDIYSLRDGILAAVSHKQVPGNPEHL